MYHEDLIVDVGVIINPKKVEKGKLFFLTEWLFITPVLPILATRVVVTIWQRISEK